jgi:hypothetical protein
VEVFPQEYIIISAKSRTIHHQPSHQQFSTSRERECATRALRLEDKNSSRGEAALLYYFHCEYYRHGLLSKYEKENDCVPSRSDAAIALPLCRVRPLIRILLEG